MAKCPTIYDTNKNKIRWRSAWYSMQLMKKSDKRFRGCGDWYFRFFHTYHDFRDWMQQNGVW